MPTFSLGIGRSRLTSSAAAVRVKEVTRRFSGPRASAARAISLAIQVVFPVPGGPPILNSSPLMFSLFLLVQETLAF